MRVRVSEALRYREVDCYPFGQKLYRTFQGPKKRQDDLDYKIRLHAVVTLVYLKPSILMYYSKVRFYGRGPRRAEHLTPALHKVPSSRGLGYFMVTSSSEEVGWIATVSSKSFFVAPILTATEKPWSISSAPCPRMWRPMIYKRPWHVSPKTSYMWSNKRTWGNNYQLWEDVTPTGPVLMLVVSWFQGRTQKIWIALRKVTSSSSSPIQMPERQQLKLKLYWECL